MDFVYLLPPGDGRNVFPPSSLSEVFPAINKVLSTKTVFLLQAVEQKVACRLFNCQFPQIGTNVVPSVSGRRISMHSVTSC